MNKDAWKQCDRCQKRIKEEKLKDEEALQSYFVTRIEQFLNSKGRRMIGWDEILEGGLAPDATVMSWRGEVGGIQAAKMGHDVVMTPGKPLYFDHYQAGPQGEPRAIGGFNTLKHVYHYNPIPEELTTEESRYVMGAQANVWTEYITTVSHLEYMVLPRMLALAEVVWTPLKEKRWDGFNQRLQDHFKAFEQQGLNYSPGNYTVAITPRSADGNLKVELSTEIPGAEIHYTLDGTVPTPGSPLYSGPIAIDRTTELKASNVQRNVVKGSQPASQRFDVHQAIGLDVAYTHPVSRYYRADGPNSLTDGVRGTDVIGKFWHGFSGDDLIATVDLGEAKTISKIALGCLQKYRDWIFMPESVTFEISQDGEVFETLGTVKNPIARDASEVQYDFTVRSNGQKARYIRVSAKNTLCPEGHSGAGKPAWIFADELVVE